MKALGLVVSEKKIFFYIFPMTPPGAGPVWTPVARLAGFMKRTTRHCYTQNMKALGFLVSEKKIFYVVPIVSLWELMTPGAGSFLTPGSWLAGLLNLLNAELTKCYEPLQKLRVRLGSCKTGLSPPVTLCY